MNTVDVHDYLANVAQKVRKCPTITLAHAYARAMRDWAVQSRWLRVNVIGATVDAQSLYDLGTDPYVDIFGIVAMSGNTGVTPNVKTFALVQSDPTTWHPDAASGQPTRYAYVPEAQFSLHPTPNAVYGLTVTVAVAPKQAAVQIPEAPLAKYGPVFEAGALAYLLDIPGQPWSSPLIAEKYAREFRAGISNAKAEAVRSFMTGAQRVPPRAFAR